MTLDSQPITKGCQVHFPKMTSSGNVLWKPGIVVDTNEAVKGVKLEFSPSKDRLKREWFALSQLKLQKPEEPKDEKTTSH